MVIKIEKLNTDVSKADIADLTKDFGDTKVIIKKGQEAYVRFKDRDNAFYSMSQLNGLFFKGSILKVSKSFFLSLIL